MLNPMGYFPQTLSGYVECRVGIEKDQNDKEMFNIRVLKSRDSRYCEYNAKMTIQGFK